MTPLRIMNLGMEGLCIIICFILLIQMQMVRARRDTDRWFKMALFSNIGMLLGDMSDWLLSGAGFSGAGALLSAGLTLFYAASGVVMFSFFAYIFHYMDGRGRTQPHFLLRIVQALSIMEVALALASPFTGAIFVVTQDNVYNRGPLFLLSHLPAAVTFLLVMLVYLRAWKAMSVKERTCFSMYLALPTLGELLQGLFYGVPALAVSLTLDFLLVSMLINSEMDAQLLDSQQRLKEERIRSLQALQDNQAKLTGEIIAALGGAVEAKDRYTNGHSQRVAQYAREIAGRMGWDKDKQEKIYYAGLLHDVGKIRISDTIITKDGRLTDEEYAQMKLHPMAGYYILKKISSIHDFAIGARWHHERWDGRGYPNGLSGENIPLIARIIGVADAYDAMTSRRSYRDIMPQETVRGEILRGAGSQFDPEIASIMLSLIDDDPGYRMRQPRMDRKRVILAVDDDPVSLRLLAKVLGQEPLYQPKIATSGAEAIAVLQREAVDLVVLDLEMPGMSGFDVLKWIRENRSGVPVIFMTGDKEIDIIQKAEHMGVSDYLTKPLVVQMLKESVQNVLMGSSPVQTG